jgi:hypothetical protein
MNAGFPAPGITELEILDLYSGSMDAYGGYDWKY